MLSFTYRFLKPTTITTLSTILGSIPNTNLSSFHPSLISRGFAVQSRSKTKTKVPSPEQSGIEEDDLRQVKNLSANIKARRIRKVLTNITTIMEKRKQKEARAMAARKRNEQNRALNRIKKRGGLQEDIKPKKPLSAFLHFLKEFTSNHPELGKSVTQRAKEGAKHWKALSDAERKPFYDAAERSKTQYLAALQQYQSSHPPPPTRPLTAYFRYASERRKEATEKSTADPNAKNPKLNQMAGVVSMIASEWRALSSADKQRYQQPASKELDQWKSEMLEWNKKYAPWKLTGTERAQKKQVIEELVQKELRTYKRKRSS